MNNPLVLDFNEYRIKFIGDPHLGRNFSIGQLPHRAGEREEIQWASFRKALTNPDKANLCVIVGDLFDQFQVGLNYVFKACRDIEAAASNFPDGIRVISGNHDLSKEAERYSSFQVAAAWFRKNQDVLFYCEGPRIEEYQGIVIGYCPWSPINSAKALVLDLDQRRINHNFTKFDVVVGHWDLESFGGSEFNLIPLKELSNLTNMVVTGHIHEPQASVHGDLSVYVTGSLEPFSHGEDPDQSLYVTLTVNEYEKAPEKYKNKCLRFLLAPEEILPEGLDCLMVTTKKTNSSEEKLEVKLDDSFNLEKIFKQCMATKSVSDDLTASLWAQCQELVSKND